ncbi:cell division control protein 48 [Pycnococcus provasolii]
MAPAVSAAAAAASASDAAAASEVMPLQNAPSQLQSPHALLTEHVIWPVRFSLLSSKLGLAFASGVLVIGAPGTGKTFLVKRVAAEICGGDNNKDNDKENKLASVLSVLSCSSVLGAGFVGDSERILREAFETARKAARSSPARTHILLIEDIDVLCPRRDAVGGVQPHEARLVAQMLTLLDGLGVGDDDSESRLAVVATTSRPHDVDDAIRRAGRLEKDIVLLPPGRQERAQMLRTMLSRRQREAAVDNQAAAKFDDQQLVDTLAARTAGYTPADLTELVRRGTHDDDWIKALSAVRPSSLRGVAVTEENDEASGQMTYDVLSACASESTRRALRRAVLMRFTHPKSMARLGVRPSRGVLLYGPPGTGKTSLARAIARAAARPLISLSASDLFAAHVGEGEANLRDAFRRAREAAPCILLIDEIDAVGGAARTKSGGGGAPGAGERLLTTLLAEMDGLGQHDGAIVLACTNRPDAVDAALLRAGRCDEVVYVGLPDQEGRLQALLAHTANVAIDGDVDMRDVASRSEGFTGADIASLVRQAAMCALDDADEVVAVNCKHFHKALALTRPSVDDEDIARYERWAMAKRH